MGVAGLQYRPCRARGETRQAPRRPGGAGKRPRRGSAHATPAGRKMLSEGGQFVTNCPPKRLRGGKNSRFSTKNRRENDNSKMNKPHNVQNAGETGGGVRNKTALKVLKKACFYKKQEHIRKFNSFLTFIYEFFRIFRGGSP